MRIKVEKSVLLQGLQRVFGAATSKNTLPILSNVLIEASDDSLKLTTTDLDIGMSVLLSINIIEDGAITVSARRFLDIVKELPDKQMEIYTKKNNTVNIESDGIAFKLLGVPKDEFPKLPAFTESEQFTIKQAALKRMLTSTFFAMSRDETRYVLNGIYFVAAKETIKMAATDGRRLAIIEQKNSTGLKEEKSVILPAKTVQEIMRSLKEEGDARITLSKNQAMFQADGLTVISRLIEGEFPNYEQVIPRETKNKIKIPHEQLFSAIKRASLLTTQESQAIKLQARKDRLVVSKATPEIGEVKEDVPVEYKGEEMVIGFNPAYLIDALKNIDEENIEMELSGPEKPCVIRTGEGYIYIVLPMQIT